MNNFINFRGNKYFLSNTYPCNVKYKGYLYKSAEAAFQAQKNESHVYKYSLTFLDSKGAKREGRRIDLIPNWDNMKDDIMFEIVKTKFEQNKDLMEKLLSIPDDELIEYNTWHDNYWGYCTCSKCKNKKKYNKLGKILSMIKEEQELDKRR